MNIQIIQHLHVKFTLFHEKHRNFWSPEQKNTNLPRIPCVFKISEFQKTQTSLTSLSFDKSFINFQRPVTFTCALCDGVFWNTEIPVEKNDALGAKCTYVLWKVSQMIGSREGRVFAINFRGNPPHVSYVTSNKKHHSSPIHQTDPSLRLGSCPVGCQQAPLLCSTDPFHVIHGLMKIKSLPFDTMVLSTFVYISSESNCCSSNWAKQSKAKAQLNGKKRKSNIVAWKRHYCYTDWILGRIRMELFHLSLCLRTSHDDFSVGFSI